MRGCLCRDRDGTCILDCDFSSVVVCTAESEFDCPYFLPDDTEHSDFDD